MKNMLMLFLIIGLIFGLTNIADYTLILIDSATFGMTGTNYAFISDLMPLTGYSFNIVNAILGIICVIASISSIVQLKSGKRKSMLFFLILVNSINILGLIGIIKEYGANDLICLKYYVTAIVYIVAIIISAKFVNKVGPMNIEDKIINLLIILVMIFAFVQPILKLTVFIKNGMYTYPADYELVLANLIEISDQWVLRYLVSQLLIVIPIICLLCNYKNYKVEIVSANILLLDGILGIISIIVKYDNFKDISYDAYLAIIISVILAGYIIYINFHDNSTSSDIKDDVFNSNPDFNNNELTNNGIKNNNKNDVKDANFKYYQKFEGNASEDSKLCCKCEAKLFNEDNINPSDEKNVLDSCNDSPSQCNSTEVISNLQSPESGGKKKTVSKKTIAIIGTAIVLVVILLFANGGKKHKLYALSMGGTDNTEWSKEYGGPLEGEAIVRNSRVDFYVKDSSYNIKYSCKLSEKITEDGIYSSCDVTYTSGEKDTIYNVYMFYFNDGELAICLPLSVDYMFLFEK